MQSSKWNAMSLLMDDKTKQAEVCTYGSWQEFAGRVALSN